jgi:hypothetical protein
VSTAQKVHRQSQMIYYYPLQTGGL